MSESISEKVVADGLEMVEAFNAQKTWRKVSHTTKALYYFSRKVILTQNENEIQQSLLPDVVVDVEPEPVDRTLLSQIVRDKNHELLRRFDGVEGVASALGIDTTVGIQGGIEEVVNRHQLYGSNAIQRPLPKTWKIMLENLSEPIIILLIIWATLALGCGIHNYGLKGGRDGGVILFAISVVITITALSKVWFRRQFNQVSKSYDAIHIDVIRNGQMDKIMRVDVVVGDIIVLKTGDQVPADGLFVSGDSLKVNESPITAEVDLIQVDYEHNPFLLSGTMVDNGSGRMIVTAVGMNTKWEEKIDSSEMTPLHAKLFEVTYWVAIAGLVISFLSLVMLIARYFTGHIHHDTRVPLHDAIVGILATSIAIAAACIPDGLLLAVTITLGYSVKRLAAHNVFVRNLTACEAIGAVTVICTSHTGSMTLENTQRVQLWFGPKAIEEAEMSENESNTSSSHWYAQEIGMDINQLVDTWFKKAETSNLETAEVSDLIEEEVDDTVHFLTRGAPMDILNKCSYICERNGAIKNIDDGIRQRLEVIIQKMETSCLRCVAFAHKKVPIISEKNEHDNFILLGLVGLKMALIESKLAGVDIKIITRENLNAVQCGIVDLNQDSANGVIVDGEEFQSYNYNQRLAMADKIRFLVRATTRDKTLMVTTLKNKGHVVAFVGNSVSDSRSLMKANVGISLGTQGADIAKESSDIVILGDSFASVIQILRWGRGIYHNIQIFTLFLITATLVSLVIDFVAAVSATGPPTIDIVTAISAGKVPYATLQVLWVKLIVGLLAALALTIEKPSEDLMQQRPENREKQPFITSIMWMNILVQALYQIAILLTIQFKGESVFNLNSREKDTIIFNIFVLCQLFLLFNTKTYEKNVFRTLKRRKLFWAMIGIITLLQFLFIELLNRVANTERLNWRQWAVCVGVSSLSWPIGWLVRITQFSQNLDCIQM